MLNNRFRKFIKKVYGRFHRYVTWDESRFLKDLERYRNWEIGDFTYGHPPTGSPEVIHFGEKVKLKIGNFCSFAEDVHIFLGGYHPTDWVTTYPIHAFLFTPILETDNYMRVKGDISIGNDVWVGAGAIILGGVTIGNGAVIGARSVVSKDVPPYGIVAGNPARLIRKRFPEDIIEKLEIISWWDWPIEKIKDETNSFYSSDIVSFIEKHIDSRT